MAAEGTKMVDPAGNSTAIPSSHNTRCPPLWESNVPRDVIPHQPNGKLAVSLCLKHVVLGPKLKVVDAQGLLGKFREVEGSESSRACR